MFQLFIENLKEELNKPLPGSGSQMKMAPESRIKHLYLNHNRINAVKSAVLISFYPENSSIKTVMIQRPEYKGVHSSQIAFPGGRYEDIDQNLYETALREAYEEVHMPRDQVNTIGQLTELYIPPSNYLVYPIIGILKNKPELKPDYKEVAEILYVDIKELIDNNNNKIVDLEVRGSVIKAPSYVINGKIIWGATAMIISELLEIIRRKSLL